MTQVVKKQKSTCNTGVAGDSGLTQVLSLSREDPLQEGMTIHCSIFSGKLHGRGAWWAIVHEVIKSWT